MLTALLILAAVPDAQPNILRDDANGFSFVIPEGYARGEPPAGILHVFTAGAPGTAGSGTIAIAGLGGTIGRDSLDRGALERGAREAGAKNGVTLDGFHYEKARWHDFEVDLVATESTLDGAHQVTFSTQVPFRKQAVQLMTMGLTTDRAQLLAAHQAVLSSLEGETNWLDDSRWSRRIGELAGTVVGLGVALVWFLRRKRA